MDAVGDAKQFLLDKAKADEAEYAAWGSTMYGQWGQASAAMQVLLAELLSVLPFGPRLVRRRAEREGWKP